MVSWPAPQVSYPLTGFKLMLGVVFGNNNSEESKAGANKSRTKLGKMTVLDQN